MPPNHCFLRFSSQKFKGEAMAACSDLIRCPLQRNLPVAAPLRPYHPACPVAIHAVVEVEILVGISNIVLVYVVHEC